VSRSPDVLIIGAGIVGAAAAFELAEAGARVHVVDRRQPAAGATQASAGMLAPYTEGHGSEALSALGQRSLDAYDDFVDRVAAAAGRRPVYNRRGTLEVARDEDHAERLRASGEALARKRIDTTWFEGGALAAEEPLLGPGAIGGLFVPCHGFVGAADLTSALLDAAASRGASVRPSSRVSRIEPAEGNRVRVLTDGETLHADRVVLAAGSWSGGIEVAGADTLPVRPVRGQLLHLRLDAPPFARVVWGADVYLVPWPDGHVLAGATVEEVGFDERATVEGVSGLLDAACLLVPRLSEATFVAARVGLRPGNLDDLPIVGPSAVVPGLIYATAHYRNGILMAPVTAAFVRGLVMDEPPDPMLDLLAPARAGRL
jgi:glycine oxidase